MKKNAILFGFLMSSYMLLGQAREVHSDFSENAKYNIGLGVGLDYGGFGGRFTLMAVEKVGLFAAVGYNLDGAGFNGGITYKFSPSKKICPTLGAMYGYNSVIVITDGPAESKTYYGPSFSFGIEVKSRRNSFNYWNFELLLPIRPKEFQNDIDNLKNNGYEVSEPLPVAFSVGFHFGMN